MISLPDRFRGFQIALFLLAGAALAVLRQPPAALAVGLVFALLVGNPFPKESKKISGTLLKIAVVLLGFGMDLGVVLEAGRDGLVFAAATILGTLVLGALIGNWLKIRKRTSALIASGTAICGGSAIAAVGAVVDAEENEMSVALGTVFILNAVALFAFPPLGHAMELSQAQFGTWAGVAIHDISSVVGAAKVYGEEALGTATAVKLSRALWIAPLALFFAWRLRKTVEQGTKAVQIPWFIGLFLLASVARTAFAPIAELLPMIKMVATAGMTVTLFLIGAGLSFQSLKEVGWRPLVQGVLLWLFISISSLLVILQTVR